MLSINAALEDSSDAEDPPAKRDESSKESRRTALAKTLETVRARREALARETSATRRAVEATTEAAGLERSRRGAVKKALPYFNAKTQGERECEDADERVRELKLSVRQAKARYDAALRALNEISEEVHARRQARKRIDHDDHDDAVAIE